MSSASPSPINLCGAPVKSMLRDYFLQFADANIINWCRTNNRKVITVPLMHRTTANLISSLRNMPVGFVQTESLWYIPKRTAVLFLECKARPGEIWGFQLCHAPVAPAWDEKHLEPLGDQQPEARKLYGMLLTTARGYLQLLSEKHQELRGIALELDKDTVALSVNDPALGVKYASCVYVKSWIMTPEEFDAAMAL